MESPVFDAGDEVVEAFSLDNVVQCDFAPLLAVAREERRIIGAGDPEKVSKVEGTGDGIEALFG